jgi:metal-responsive CopG/Arc/MetJ family transcriptional regulator
MQKPESMQTVQVTLDKKLLAEVDAAVRRARTTRSAFTRQALRAYLEHLREAALERKHREGYRRKPVRPREFKVWEAEQAWGDG